MTVQLLIFVRGITDFQDYRGAGSNVLTERNDNRERFIHGGKCVHGQAGTEWDRRAGVTKHGCPNLMG